MLGSLGVQMMWTSSIGLDRMLLILTRICLATFSVGKGSLRIELKGSKKK